MITTLLIKSILLSFVITQFEPIRWILNLFKQNFLVACITLLLTCWKCCAFWISLIMTHNIYWASLAFAITYILDIIKEKLKQ